MVGSSVVFGKSDDMSANGARIDAIIEVVADTTDLHEMAAAAEMRLLAIIIVAFALVFSLLAAVTTVAFVRRSYLPRVKDEPHHDVG